MDLHPAGTFPATILDHGFGTKKNGKGYYWTKFSTGNGESEIVGFFSLTDAAAPYTVDKIKAMGYDGRNMLDLADGTLLRDAECVIVVDHNEGSDGKVRAEVGWVYKAGSSGGLQHNEDAAANASQYNHLFGPAAVAETTGGALDTFDPAAADDDIPF